MKAYVLKETESGRFRCNNLYVSDESYHFNVVNASMYSDKKEAEYHAKSLNRMTNREFVKVVEIEITINE